MKYVAITVEWSKKKEHKNLCTAYKRYMHRSFFCFFLSNCFTAFIFWTCSSLYLLSFPVCTQCRSPYERYIEHYCLLFFYKWKIEGQNVSFVMFMLVICWFFYFSIPVASSIFYLELREEKWREFPVSISFKNLHHPFLLVLFSLRQGCYLHMCFLEFLKILSHLEMWFQMDLLNLKHSAELNSTSSAKLNSASSAELNSNNLLRQPLNNLRRKNSWNFSKAASTATIVYCYSLFAIFCLPKVHTFLFIFIE